MSTEHTWSEKFASPDFCGVHLVGFIVVEEAIYGEHLKYGILDEQYIYIYMYKLLTSGWILPLISKAVRQTLKVHWTYPHFFLMSANNAGHSTTPPARMLNEG